MRRGYPADASAVAGGSGHGGGLVSDVDRGSDAGERLLVVDDDPFIARLLEIELAAAGFQVRVANDGQQARRPRPRGGPRPGDHRRDDAPRRRVRAHPAAPPGPADRPHLRDHPHGARPVRRQARGVRDRRGRLHRQAVRHAGAARAGPRRAAPLEGDARRVTADRAPRQRPRAGGDRDRVVAGEEFALLLTDVDHFKAFNDHYGFPRGDEVIQAIGDADRARSPPSSRARRPSSPTWAATTSRCWCRRRPRRWWPTRSSSGSTSGRPRSSPARTPSAAGSRC